MVNLTQRQDEVGGEMRKFLYGLCVGLIIMAVVALPNCGSSSSTSSVTAGSSVEARVKALEATVAQMQKQIASLSSFDQGPYDLEARVSALEGKVGGMYSPSRISNLESRVRALESASGGFYP